MLICDVSVNYALQQSQYHLAGKGCSIGYCLVTTLLDERNAMLVHGWSEAVAPIQSKAL